MDRERIKKDAAGFTGGADCFIHTEMKDGKRCETIMAGDILAIIHGINGEVNRLAELSRTSYKDILDAMQKMYKHSGYSKDLYASKGDVSERLAGSDWYQELEENVRKEYAETMAAKEDSKVAVIRAKLDDAYKMVAQASDRERNIKEAFEKKIKEKDKQILSLSKEIKKLEHDIITAERRVADTVKDIIEDGGDNTRILKYLEGWKQ